MGKEGGIETTINDTYSWSSEILISGYDRNTSI